ncbi:helix-turn-helix domain-containing protein [Pseudomonas sp. S31]|nr:helix-turn-helix domain-containing protein [Pseudomonas sp. S31]
MGAKFDIVERSGLLQTLEHGSDEVSAVAKQSRHIQSVERAMALLEQLSTMPRGTGLATLCRNTGLSKSTAHGLLSTLVDLGYVSNEGNEYTSGSRIRSITTVHTDSADWVRELFTPALHAFNEICQRNSYLAIPSGTRSYLTLDSLDQQGSPLSDHVDARRDAVRTSAVGKIFLAHDRSFARRVRRNASLDHDLEHELMLVKESGFAFDISASRPGLHCMAIPLRHQGVLVGALGISGAEEDMEPRWMEVKARQAVRELASLVCM